MADQQRKVSLIFEANASQAKNEINGLVQSLQKIQSMPRSLIDPTGIKEASKAAMELQGHIQKAVNVDTGKLDLSRFATSLASSGKSLDHYRDTLMRIGPEGSAAFRSVLSSINNAEVSTVRLTKGMRDFLTTMKNTAKWQISSSIMHGLIGGLQSAWGYAQSLDRSLNDIRIVTGQTSEQMARFAAEANKAAQTLSTTTTKYTDAALIFYQQGLGDNAVKERTEAVIKMANVTGEAAKDVSSYMTAIWNNFDKGTKPLEYYGDVITKLGAATAASSEEIAGGLEKFAAIANTIGLSYEYATSMITTIVDKTRQSEDVVGTALKTILARIQGLNLGETLEDGTTLNKYSEALATVGVHIKDASGQIKNMDVILDDLGAKWGTLGKDTQIALAQVVGGVRQYNQVLSLMDNWGSFEKNVGLAQMSSGSLNKQADIYAESWEAARDRVRAAAEGIYDALINEDVFIKLDDIFTHLLNGVSGVVKGMGGMIPMLSTIGGLITTKFAKEMPVYLNNMAQNFAVLSGKANRDALNTQKDATRLATEMRDSAGDEYTYTQYDSLRRVSMMKEELLSKQNQLNSAQKAEYEALIQNEQAIRSIVEQRAQALMLIQEEANALRENAALEAAMNAPGDSKAWKQAEDEAKASFSKSSQRYQELEQKAKTNRGANLTDDEYAELERLKAEMSSMDEALPMAAFDQYVAKVKEAIGKMGEFSEAQGLASRRAKEFTSFAGKDHLSLYAGQMDKLKMAVEGWRDILPNTTQYTDILETALNALGDSSLTEAQKMEAVATAAEKIANAQNDAAQSSRNLANAEAQRIAKEYNVSPEALAKIQGVYQKQGYYSPGVYDPGSKEPPKIEKQYTKVSQTLASSAGALMSVYGAFNAILSAHATLMDEDATAMQKVGAVVGVLTSVMMAANSILSLNTTLQGLKIVQDKKTFMHTLANIAAKKAETAANAGNTASIWANIAAWTAWMASNPIGWIMGIVAALVALGVALATMDWRSDEQKYLDDLKEKSEALSKAQENLEQQIKDVQSAWDNYQDMVDALKDCTVGTEAWYEALLNCNQAVLSLIALAPGLSQFVQYNDDGSISLGGIGYEEYMQKLTRKNNALQAGEMIVNNKIAQAELESYYGKQGIYDPINAFVAENKYGEKTEDQFKFFADFLNTVFDAFGDNMEEAQRFLEDLGIENASEIVVERWASEKPLTAQSASVINSAHLFKPENVASVLGRWSQDLVTYDNLEKSNKAAYSAFFGTLQGYEADNLKVYGNRFEEAIEEALKDDKKDYATEDKSTLQKLMAEAFNGKAEDYADMSVDDMQYALAIADVSTNLEILNGIVADTNSMLAALNSAGQSLIREGNLSAASLAELGAVSGTTSKLIEPLGWTVEDRDKLESLKEWDRDVDFSGLSLDEIDTLDNSISVAREGLATASKIREIDYIKMPAAKGKEEDLAIESALARPLVDMKDSVISMANSYAGIYSRDLSMTSPTTTAAERQDFALYDLWRAQLPTASDKEKLFGWIPSEKDTLTVDMAEMEEKYGAEYLQSRPVLTEEQAYTNLDYGMSTGWEEPLEVLDNWVDQAPLVLEDVNRQLEEAGLTIRATHDSLLDGTFEAALEEELRGKPGAEAIAAEKDYWRGEERDSVELAQDREGLIESSAWTEEALINTATDYFKGVRDLIQNTFSAEDAEQIMANIADGMSTEEAISGFIPKDVYIDYVDKVKSALGENFKDLFESDEAFKAFETLTEKEQFEYLNTDEVAYQIERSLNGAQESVAKQILGIAEDADLFESLVSQGLIDESQLSATDYSANWELARAKALEKDPEALYRSEVLSALGVDEGEYLIDPENAEITQKNAEKFAKEFGILTAEEIADGVSWEEIATRFNELVIEAMEQAISGWNSGTSSRFQTQLEVDQETGKFVQAEGTTASVADDLLLTLAGAGASAQALNAFTDDIGAIAPGLTSEGFGAIATSMKEMIDNGADVNKVMSAFNEILEQTQTKGAPLTDKEVAKIMEDSGIAVNQYEGCIEDLTGTVYDAIDSITSLSDSLSGFISTLESLQKLVGITTGTEISKEDYEAIPEEYRDLFLRSTGGYTFYGTEEQGREIERAAREKVWEERTATREQAQTAGSEVWGKGLENIFDVEDPNLQGSIVGWAVSGGLLDPKFLEFANATGLVGEGYIEALSNANALDFDENGKHLGEDEEIQNAAVALGEAVTGYLRGDYENTSTEEAQLKMTGIQSLGELYSSDISIGEGEGQITQAQYDAVESSLLDKKATESGFDVEEVEEYAKYLKETNEEYKDFTDNQLKNAAIAAKKLERGVKKLNEEWEDNKEILEDATSSEEEKFKAMKDTQDALEDIYDMDLDSIEGFNMSEFMDEETKALIDTINGGGEEAEDAMLELGKKLSEATGDITEEELATEIPIKVDGQEAMTTVSSLRDYIIGELSNLEPGPINDANIINSLTAMLNACASSVGEANRILSSMGVEATVKEVPIGESQTTTKTLTSGSGSITASILDGAGSIELVGSPVGEIEVSEKTTPGKFFTIEGANYTGGGIKTGGSRRGGGGGGRGGGGGSRRPRAEKKQASDKQRYHTVTNQLEDLTDAYDKVSKAADRAFGKSRIKLLREQQDALKDLAATQQDYIDEINNYYKQDLSNLDQVSQYVGFDIQFDENGTITNFDAIQDKMYDMYNSHINDDGEVTDMDEEAWEDYEEEWEDIMALIEQYEETQDLRKEALQQLQDYINEIYDLQLEEVTYAVEVDIEASDDALEILDYLLSRIEDDAWKAAEAIAYMGNQAATMLDQSNTYTSGIRDILMNHTEDIRDSEGRLLQKAQLTQADVEGFMTGDEGAINKLMGLNNAFTDEEIQSLRDYHSSLIEMNETLVELRENVFEKVLDSFEQFNEEMEESIDKMNHLTAITNYYKDVIDIVGKKNLGVSNTLLESLGQAGVEQGIQTVRMMAERRDTIKTEIESAEAAMRAAKSEEDIEHWKKVLKEMNQSLMEAEQEVLDSTTDTLQSIAEQYELVINNIGETLSDALAGPVSKSLEDLQTSFDRANTLTDHYLPDYEKIYELSKLNRDIVNSIDETDNIKAKQELASLQAEINALEESETKITEYQMENLRRRYELKLAEMALTEAQDAKSQVQMSRDADGNWSYVYTANEDQVAEAEQNYEDKLYAMQEANAEYIKTLGEEIINLRVEAHETLMGIANDLTLSEEERLIKLTEAQAFFNERESQLTGELAIVLGENQTLYEQDWTAYSNLTGYKISLDENYIDKFEETQLAVETGVNNINDFHATLAIGMEAAIQRVVDAMKVFSDSYEETTSYTIDQGKTFAESMTDHMNEVLEASENTANEFEEMGEKIETTFTDLTTAVQNWSNEYSSTIDSILEKNTILAESFNKVLAAYSKYTEATVGDSEPANETGDEEEPVEEPTTEEEPQKPEGLGTVSIKKGYQMYYRKGPGTGYKSLGIAKAKNEQKNYTYSKKEGKWVFIDALGGWMNGQYKRYTWLTPFDTGGYTGSWGSEGRVAMLHEKEIVLNKDDTANLLTAVDIIRQISKTIDLNAYSSAGYGNSLIRTGMGSAGTLEQHVQITAEFPNATNREEIYSAFTDIINLASQYANKK